MTRRSSGVNAESGGAALCATRIAQIGEQRFHRPVAPRVHLDQPSPGIDDDRSKNAFGLMMSLNMLIETPGGFDYTGADCQGWMKEAGFASARVEHLVGPDSMVVATK